MYSQSIPRVEMEWDELTRDLDARFDPRIGRPMTSSDPRPFGLQDAPVALRRPSVGRRIFRALTRFLMAVLIGIGATLGWQSQGDAAREMVTAGFPSLGRLLPVPTTKSPAVAAIVPAALQQLELLALDLDAVRRSVEQLAARQQQMAENIATVQAVADDIRERMSTIPPAKQTALIPPHKTSQSRAQAMAAQASAVQSSSAPRPLSAAGASVLLH